MSSLGKKLLINDSAPLISIIQRLGLTANLELCLDAGDKNSYDTAVDGTRWRDTSGNSYDFYLGLTGSGTDTPTFNGTIGGLSKNEYFSYDGGDFFYADSANPTWVESLHRNNAAFTFFGMSYVTTVASSTFMFATRGSSGRGMTANYVRNTTGSPLLYTVSLTRDSNLNPSTNSWFGVGISENEAAGTVIFSLNNTTESLAGTYSSPTTLDASTRGTIGATGGGATKNPSGSRIGCFAAWSTPLTATNLTDLYNEVAKRYV